MTYAPPPPPPTPPTPPQTPATKLLIQNARVLTMGDGDGPLRGDRCAHVGALDNTDVLIEGHLISRVAHGITPTPDARVIDARSRVLMPAFVDCHTHMCSAGDRIDEWQQRLAGASYLEILKAGGGIMSTVRAVRAATRAHLRDTLLERLHRALDLGTTTIEVKSGYGLTTEHEIKMLEAIHDAGEQFPGTVVPTALLGHALDPDVPRERFVETTIHETLDEVARCFPAVAVDAYCEDGAWSVDECARLFDRARRLGHPVRVHADQFNPLGMLERAVRDGYRSVDHLEASSNADLTRLGASETFAVLLPASGFHLDQRYANARPLLHAGGAVAIATNDNPGSAPGRSMPFAMALASRFCGLFPVETIPATTRNPSCLLGLEDRGRIRQGVLADLLLLDERDERMICFEPGHLEIAAVVCRGKLL